MITKSFKVLSLLIVIASFLGCEKINDPYLYEDELGVSWKEMADRSTDVLLSQFWNSEEHYFNYGNNNSNLDFHYWPNAHAMDVVIDAFLRTKDEEFEKYFQQWFEGVRIKNGNTYYNNFYDDMQWNALTMLRLYNVTNEQVYLDVTIDLWKDIIKGWNEEFAGGGIAWEKQQLYSKNACSNGPASILAARLYNVTGDEEYLDWSQKIYEWQKNTLFNRVTGAVYDNINGQTDEINTVSLTYNQGTFLGAAVELYKITQNPVYLNDSQKTANYTLTKCIDAANNVLRDEGSGDGGLFKGIFMRYLVQYLQIEEGDEAFRLKFESFLKNNAKIAWTKGTNPDLLLFGPNWAEVPIGQTTQLTSQISAAMLFEQASFYEND